MPASHHTPVTSMPVRTTSLRRVTAVVSVAVASAALSASAAGSQVTVRGPVRDGNSIPFAYVSPSPSDATTRYQQVYRAGAFPGPINIGAISFFRFDSGQLASGTFDLYLSATRSAVDALDTVNFDANLGASVALFGTFTIGGPAPELLTFNGAPYLYDPSAGNLLLDLRVRGRLTLPGSNASFVGSNDLPGGNYSRAHNFAAGFAGYGLDTRFDVAVVPEPATLALSAAGALALAGFAALRRRA